WARAGGRASQGRVRSAFGFVAADSTRVGHVTGGQERGLPLGSCSEHQRTVVFQNVQFEIRLVFLKHEPRRLETRLRVLKQKALRSEERRVRQRSCFQAPSYKQEWKC